MVRQLTVPRMPNVVWWLGGCQPWCAWARPRIPDIVLRCKCAKAVVLMGQVTPPCPSL